MASAAYDIKSSQAPFQCDYVNMVPLRHGSMTFFDVNAVHESIYVALSYFDY